MNNRDRLVSQLKAKINKEIDTTLTTKEFSVGTIPVNDKELIYIAAILHGVKDWLETDYAFKMTYPNREYLITEDTLKLMLHEDYNFISHILIPDKLYRSFDDSDDFSYFDLLVNLDYILDDKFILHKGMSVIESILLEKKIKEAEAS